ncbi:DMT family transporter [Gimesia aquarii]|uniref:Quaternary ammonium compound-resistance protein QacC n=1 Tax=Gimesia aquarii TaxID=2527964 RepID=A0A517VU16_9PLAN|nr:multidrug efflux SMR transporter [Gimesia aquarii]QDT96492.1 Quaternary ammonium compound-resistance protein QacC [Gimesia aquarii]
MKWLWLLSSITCEVIGTTFLKLASGDSPHTTKYSVGVVVFYVLCFALLGQAMRSFPLGTVYAIWSGVGVSLLAIIGVICFGDEVNALKIVSLILVILGIVGLNMSGISH